MERTSLRERQGKALYQKEVPKVLDALAHASGPLSFNQILRLCAGDLHKKYSDKRNRVLAALMFLQRNDEVRIVQEKKRTLYEAA